MRLSKQISLLVLSTSSVVLVGCASNSDVRDIVFFPAAVIAVTGMAVGEALSDHSGQIPPPKPKPPRTEIAIVATQNSQGTGYPDQSYKFILKNINGHEFTAEPTGVELPPGRYTFTYEIRFYQAVAPRMWLNRKWYDIEVSVKKGKQMFVAFDSAGGGSVLCALFISEDKIFPTIESEDFPLAEHFDRTCVNVGVDLSDSAWVKLTDIPGRHNLVPKTKQSGA